MKRPNRTKRSVGRRKRRQTGKSGRTYIQSPYRKAAGFVICTSGYDARMRIHTPLAVLLLLLAAVAPAVAACTSQTGAVANTPALGFRFLKQDRHSVTYSITVDTHTAAPVPYPKSGLAVKLLEDGRVFRQVMFAMTTRASFVAEYPQLKHGRHEVAAQLLSDDRLIAVQTHCVTIR